MMTMYPCPVAISSAPNQGMVRVNFRPCHSSSSTPNRRPAWCGTTIFPSGASSTNGRGIARSPIVASKSPETSQATSGFPGRRLTRTTNGNRCLLLLPGGEADLDPFGRRLQSVDAVNDDLGRGRSCRPCRRWRSLRPGAKAGCTVCRGPPSLQWFRSCSPGADGFRTSTSRRCGSPGPSLWAAHNGHQGERRQQR